MRARGTPRLRRIPLGPVALFAALALGCDDPGVSAEEAVRAADRGLQEAIVARDADRTASFYARGAALLPTAEPAIVGDAAIRAEWTKLFAIPGFSNVARIVAVEVSRSGDLAYTRGTYETRLTAPDGKPVIERGKWVTIWRRQPDGSWRIVVDIYNTDSPPPDHL